MGLFCYVLVSHCEGSWKKCKNCPENYWNFIFQSFYAHSEMNRTLERMQIH